MSADASDVGSPGLPLISVVMPCFNSERYLREAVQSVLGQSHGNVELIVVNDGSTDDTGERLQGWAGRDRRCRVFQAAGLCRFTRLRPSCLAAYSARSARSSRDNGV